MKLTTRYILGGISITIGCFIWFNWASNPLIGTLFVVASSFFTQPNEWAKEIKLGIPKWNTRGFFSSISILLGLALFIILTSRLPDGQFEELFGTWYFTGVLWLLFLSMLTTRFIEEKRKSRQSDGPLSSESALSDDVSS